MGLCSSHYQQKVRGRPLVPLRQRPVEPLVTLGLRVPQLVREAASADPAGARAALVAWVAARDARDAGVRPTLASVNRAKRAGRSERKALPVEPSPPVHYIIKALPPAPVVPSPPEFRISEPSRPAKRTTAKAPSCLRCGMPATALIHGEGPNAVNTHRFVPGQDGRQR
jgi:hypothetical protein